MISLGAKIGVTGPGTLRPKQTAENASTKWLFYEKKESLSCYALKSKIFAPEDARIHNSSPQNASLSSTSKTLVSKTFYSNNEISKQVYGAR